MYTSIKKDVRSFSLKLRGVGWSRVQCNDVNTVDLRYDARDRWYISISSKESYVEKEKS